SRQNLRGRLTWGGVGKMNSFTSKASSDGSPALWAIAATKLHRASLGRSRRPENDPKVVPHRLVPVGRRLVALCCVIAALAGAIASQAQAAQLTWVALGDSYSAGIGGSATGQGSCGRDPDAAYSAQARR